jgi:hypothetical protein
LLSPSAHGHWLLLSLWEFIKTFQGFMEKGDNLLETIFLVKLSITFPEIILFFADDIIQMGE